MNAIKSILIAMTFVLALYLGSGGFIYLQNEQNYEAACKMPKKEVKLGSIQFYNEGAMTCLQEQDLILSVYPYVHSIPAALRYIITALSFGIIGAIGRLISIAILSESRLQEIPNLLLIPLQGAIIGLIVLGISYTIPIFLNNESTSLKPITVVFLSLFGGVSYLEFYPSFTVALQRKFEKEKSQG